MSPDRHAATGGAPRAPVSRAERAAWLALLGAAAVTRLWDLGARVMSHDESLHAYFSFLFFRDGAYAHDPSLHGPLLYHLGRATFVLVGASDATARLAPALLGVACVALLWPLRRWIGPAAALAAGVLGLISPILLYYSRYLRNDVTIAVLTLVWAIAMFRYLEERSPRWLWLGAGALTLSFACKEVAFIHGALFGAWALSLAMARRRSAAAGDLAALWLALVLPFAAGAIHFALGWPTRDDRTAAMLVRSLASTGALGALALGLAAAWFGRGAGRRSHGGPGFRAVACCLAASWALLLVLFSGLGHAPRSGAINGMVGSLGYWLEQHGVARGGQPWFYYAMLALLYELLPLLLALGGFVMLARGVRRRLPVAIPSWGWLDAAGAPERAAGATAAAGASRAFLDFCVWWALASFTAYTVAGEKMPWLLVHPVLPLLPLGGWALASLLAGLGRALRSEAPARRLVALGALLPAALVAASGIRPFGGRDAAAIALTMRWLAGAALVLGLAAWAVVLVRRAGRRRGLRWLAAGLVALLALGTVRAAYRAAYVDADLATELLVYAHSTPDVKTAMREIERLGARTTGDPRGLAVAHEHDTSWPFAWYLRDFPNARVIDAEATSLDPPPVLLTGSPPSDVAWAATLEGYDVRELRRSWWPIETYRHVPPREWLTRASRLDFWLALREIVLHRRYPGVSLAGWPGAARFQMHVRRDLAGLGEALPFELARVAPALPAPAFEPVRLRAIVPELVIAGPLLGRDLERPTAIAPMPGRGWAIADAGNDRVLVVDNAGAAVRSLGAAPDGRGTAEERLQQPWGVAAGPAGEIAVADTWGGRVVVFDGAGRLLAAWGRFGALAGAPGGSPDEAERETPLLYGPRGLVFDASGALLVADTGNRRLLRFSPAGELLEAIDRGAEGPGDPRFSEPVGLALEADGSLLVADAWNRRIQRLRTGGERVDGLGPGPDAVADPAEPVVARWRVPGWFSTLPEDKPYLAVGPRGRIYATDPESGRVLVFTPRGELVEALRLPASGEGRRARPIGIAWDAATERMAVADAEGDRVLVWREVAAEDER
jgi:uncharacterized protein (TIGR03663 family)